MNFTEIVSAERSLIGAMITDPTAIDQAANTLTAASFFDPKSARMFTLLVDLREAGLPTSDSRLLITEVKRRSVFESERHAHEIASFVTDSCGYGLAEYVCGEIAKAAEHRRLAAVAERFTAMLKESDDPAQVSEWIVAQIESGRELSVADRPEMLADVVAQLGTITTDSGRAIPTGLQSLDGTIGGYRPQQLILIGARPSIGKSVLGFQTAKHAATAGYRSMFISIEMPSSELGARSLAMDCGLCVPVHA